MRWRDITEAESVDMNRALLAYFEERPVDMGPDNLPMHELWRYFVHDYLNDENKNKLVAFLGHDSIDDVSPADYDRMPPRGKRFFANWLTDTNEIAFILHEDPHLAPAWMLLEPVTNKLLPSSTWLAHFTDHAEAIQRDGFRFGQPDIQKIALTWENNLFSGPRRKGSTEPGYNYAYSVKKIELDRRVGWYGKDVLLFRSSGLLVHHDGDREEQVVFWGPSAKLRGSQVLRQQDSQWVSQSGMSAPTLSELVRMIIR